MGKQQVLTRGIALAVVFAVAVFAGSGSIIAASKNCSRLGTWHGVENSGVTWIASYIPGQSATVGQLVLVWVSLGPTLGGSFPSVVRVTDALGVWEKVNQKKYNFTWVSYGLDANGSTVYVARVSAVALMQDCSHANFNYALELFSPEQDLSKDSPTFGTTCGAATETRMSLVQATCPE